MQAIHLSSDCRAVPMMREGVLVLVAVMLFAACGQEHTAEVAPEVAAHSDPAVVLNAFVDSWCAENEYEPPVAFLFYAATSSQVQSEEKWEKSQIHLRKELEGLRSDTLDSFARANAASLELHEILQSRHTLHFIKPDEKEALRSTRNSHEWDGGHRKLMRKYPGVRETRSLSAPGVSSDGLQALVYATWFMGARVAEGNYYLLAWEDGQWRVVDRALAWIS